MTKFNDADILTSALTYKAELNKSVELQALNEILLFGGTLLTDFAIDKFLAGLNGDFSEQEADLSLAINAMFASANSIRDVGQNWIAVKLVDNWLDKAISDLEAFSSFMLSSGGENGITAAAQIVDFARNWRFLICSIPTLVPANYDCSAF